MHFFISMLFVSQVGFTIEPLLHVLSISILVGVDLVAGNTVKDRQVIVAEWTINVDLKIVNMTDFNVILRMDWLAKKNYVNIDCHKKEVAFAPPNGSNFKFKGTCTGVTPKIILMMKIKRLVQQGGWAIRACVVNIKGKKKTMDTVPIVNEFSDVFREDLPRIPLS